MANRNNILNEVDRISVATNYYCDTEFCNTEINKSTTSLKIITQNIRSIQKNMDNFQAQLARFSFEFDVIILTECWLSNDKLIPLIDGYSAHYSKILQNQNDGIVIYVKHELKCEIKEPEPAGASFILLNIYPDTCILAVYRSPSIYCTDNFLNSLDRIIRPIKAKNIVLTGDINIDIKANNTDRNSESYLNTTAELGLLPGHTYPTRLQNCLDHMLLSTSNPATVFVIDSTVTDHASVVLNICQYRQRCEKVNIVSKTNYDDVVKHLETVDFSFINDGAESNNAATLLIENITTAIQLNTTKFNRPSRKRLLKPWLTPGLLRCIRHRDKLHKKSSSNPDNLVLETSYKRYRNFCNTLLRKLKINYERSLLQNSNNNKDKWDAVKTITNQKKQNITADNLIKSTKHTNSLEEINEYFSNVGKKLADNISTLSSTDLLRFKHNIPMNPKSIVLLPPDEAEIEAIILNLSNDCAVGWDSIPAKLLKMARHILVPHLTKLIELCFVQGVFPRVLKKSLITPVYKSGLKDDVENYRPISVLSTISKILEKVLNTRLISFLEHNKILSDSQFGFRQGRSTEDAVGQLVDHLSSCIDTKQKCVGIFLDLAKAFDTVSIPLLVDKLERIGIRGNALGIFSDFLQDRTQTVKICGHVSSDARVVYGVPQGSILGPSLFLVYINDLCQQTLTKGKIFTYADDTALVFHGETWDEVKQNAEIGLYRVSQWLRANLLTLNVTKSTLVQFSFSKVKPQQIDVKYHECNSPSGNVPCSCVIMGKSRTVKYLGVILDDKLNWKQHIELTTTRIRKLIWIFKKLRNVADLELLRMVYYALAQSVIGYCIGIWGGAFKSHMITLERAQRSVLKVMTFRPFRFPTTTLYNMCKVLTVRQMYIYQLVIKQHIITPCNKVILRKRTLRNICPVIVCQTTSARRQRIHLSNYLYNKTNRELRINPLSLQEVKTKVKSWLLTLDYTQTESLLQ